MPKNKFVSFDVTFLTLPYLTDAATERKRCESIFIQNQVFASQILTAITLLTPESGVDVEISDSELSLCIQTLAFTGQTFTAEMYEQFQKLLEITEAKDE